MRSIDRRNKVAYIPREAGAKEKERRGPRRLNKKRLLTFLLVLLFIYLLTVIVEQSFASRGIKERLTGLEEKVETYESKNEELRAEQERLQDYEYIEMLARRRLGLVRPGEVIFIFEE